MIHNESKKSTWPLAIFGLALLVIAIAAALVFSPASSRSPASAAAQWTPEPTPTPWTNVTMVNYERLYPGMHYGDVAKILGRFGTEMGRTEFMGVRTVVYSWPGNGGLGSNITATFQNDRLISKAQIGLR